MYKVNLRSPKRRSNIQYVRNVDFTLHDTLESLVNSPSLGLEFGIRFIVDKEYFLFLK